MLDADGTLAPTSGECKSGMDVSLRISKRGALSLFVRRERVRGRGALGSSCFEALDLLLSGLAPGVAMRGQGLRIGDTSNDVPQDPHSRLASDVADQPQVGTVRAIR